MLLFSGSSHVVCCNRLGGDITCCLQRQKKKRNSLNVMGISGKMPTSKTNDQSCEINVCYVRNDLANVFPAPHLCINSFAENVKNTSSKEYTYLLLSLQIVPLSQPFLTLLQIAHQKNVDGRTVTFVVPRLQFFFLPQDCYYSSQTSLTFSTDSEFI